MTGLTPGDTSAHTTHGVARAQPLARDRAWDEQFPEDQLVVVRQRHPGRWVFATVLALLAVAMLRLVVSNPNFAWPTVAHYLFNPTILSGMWVTCWLTVVTMLLGVLLGVALAVMRLSRNPLIAGASASFIWFFRGTPVLVQIIFWYNLAILFPEVHLAVPFGPTLFSASMNDLITPFTAAILGLGLNEAAYMAEIVRAGIASVDEGQQEASRALGMRELKVMRRIILPQAMPFVIPPTGNETIGMLKMTSLVSVISLSDVLYSAQTIYSRTYETIPLLLVACFWYLLATSVLSLLQRRIERHFDKGRREPG
ncbi:amino acid ABC transporter permease [Pseudomonas typographi]|uniref:Amino acid ABC transporter permease n=1 Tax=Pseudomonas typographi TaxID=2715964 RepID=A0ABR7YZ21_9PSED|nr:amino acid ABC transporter permease [Pseudomonas typographi]MBD1554731.1 amino acid ABC transporter permease [Pseudomonas typographi]MBD1589105.1 amino acid ABC transporter permease [Pseudomonas typographi]MBD1598374.1 amino acid ABC transporter permease [Pseudomonas typographi]